MLKVTILGCGSSLGVPMISCNCKICSSSSSYNKRTRSSIYIDDGNSQILIDFGFDIKYQIVREGIKKLDAAILTHYHADHVSGIDNLRVFPFIQNKPLEIFSDHESMAKTIACNKYLFTPEKLIARSIDFFEKFTVKTLDIQCFKQNHGSIDSLGLRIGNFVYSSDVLGFPEESKSFLEDIKIWVLDCVDYKANNTHAGLAKVLEWNDQFKPEQIFLTNMSHAIDYHEISKILPNNIKPLYDGYKIII